MKKEKKITHAFCLGNEHIIILENVMEKERISNKSLALRFILDDYEKCKNESDVIDELRKKIEGIPVKVASLLRTEG